MANKFLPNIGDVAANRKELAWPDALHFDTLIAAKALNGVLDGCKLSADGGGARRVRVAVGCVVIDGVTKTVATQTVDLDTGDAQGNPRLDLITINTSGTVVVEKGDVAGVPVYDTIPASRVVLGGVLIVDGQTTVVEGDINDMGIDLSRQPLVMHRTTTTTGPDTTVAETTTFTYTIPGRALGIDGGIRLTMIGQHLHAVSSHTLILRVKLGATTLMASSAMGLTANTDPRTWKMVIELFADGSLSAQKTNVKYDATTPLAAQLLFHVGSATDDRFAQGYVESTEDMSADRALVVTAQVSVSSALNSFKTELAYIERIPPA